MSPLLAQSGVSLRRTDLVAFGGEADIARAPPAWPCEAIDPNVWSGRALQENFDRDGGCAVLHQCIRPLIGAFVLRAIMGISARAISLADRPQRGHSGHQCSHAPGRPILHLVLVLSQTSAGKTFQLFALNHAA